MFDRLKSAGSEFAFWMSLEVLRPKIVDGFQEWLSEFTLEEFKGWILHDKMPPVSADMFKEVTGYAKFLKKVSVTDLCELIGEARPELLEMIMSMDQQGANYMIKMRAYLWDCLLHPEKAPAIVNVGEKPAEMSKCTCDQCKKSWSVKKGTAVEKCPFCGAAA